MSRFNRVAWLHWARGAGCWLYIHGARRHNDSNLKATVRKMGAGRWEATIVGGPAGILTTCGMAKRWCERGIAEDWKALTAQGKER